jgi:hypothetical protein
MCYLRKVALLAIAAAGLAACQSTAIERGDSAFRSGNYNDAWAIYQEAGDPAEDPALATRLARTRWFMVEDGLRHLLAIDEPQRVLNLLPRLATGAPADRAPALAEIHSRAQNQLATQYARAGLAATEADLPVEALHYLTLAVAWNPEDELAATGLARTVERLEREGELGTSFYFEGMEHMRQSHDLRARTSFHHAAVLLGEDSRAQERFEALAEDLAEQSRGEARLFLDAGLLGPAFLSIRTAERLIPEHAATLELMQRLDSDVRSAQALIGADLAIRGGYAQRADLILEEIAGFGVAEHASEAHSLTLRNDELKLDQAYKLGRAFELDEQILHAAAQFREIHQRAAGFGWQDSEFRLSNLEQRIAAATRAFAAALAAEAAGDSRTYRAHLEDTVRLASDFEDAIMRLAVLRAADHAPTVK